MPGTTFVQYPLSLATLASLPEHRQLPFDSVKQHAYAGHEGKVYPVVWRSAAVAWMQKHSVGPGGEQPHAVGVATEPSASGGWAPASGGSVLASGCAKLASASGALPSREQSHVPKPVPLAVQT
jgi:hypothetical protein